MSTPERDETAQTAADLDHLVFELDPTPADLADRVKDAIAADQTAEEA